MSYSTNCLCSKAFKDTIEKMKWNNEIWHQFWKFLPFSALFGHYLWESRDNVISSFSDHIREILTKFHQDFAEKWPNSSTKIGMKWNFISFRPKSLTVFCWNFEVLAVRRQRNHLELEKSWNRHMKKAWPAFLNKKQILWFDHMVSVMFLMSTRVETPKLSNVF